jgi:hypothetical protein
MSPTDRSDSIFRWAVLPTIVILGMPPHVGVGAEQGRTATTPAVHAPAPADFVTATAEHLRLEATVAFRGDECARWKRAGGDLLLQRVLETVHHPAGQVRLAEVFAANSRALNDALSAAAGEADRRNLELTNQWQPVHETLLQQRQQVFQLQTALQVKGDLAFLLGTQNRWLWLAALVVLLALVGVVCHARRHEIRRWRSGSRARAISLTAALVVLGTVLGGVTVGAFFFAEPIARLLLGSEPAGDNRERQRELLDQEATLRVKADEASTELDAMWRSFKGHAETSFPGAGELLDRRRETQGHVEALAVALDVQAGLAEHLESEIRQCEELQGRAQALQEQAQATDQRRRTLRWGLSLGLLGLVSLGNILFCVSLYLRRRTIRQTCPFCLKRGKLVPMPQTAGGQTGVPKVQCGASFPGTKTNKCEFILAAADCSKTKLCFPTLGAPETGKTLWLAKTCYKLNRNRDCGSRAKLFPVPSRVTKLLEEIAASFPENPPPATQTSGIPEPLVLLGEDGDSWGTSDMVLSIFDYAGAITTQAGFDEDARRQRALKAEGFLFFVDPTMPEGEQSKALHDFVGNVRFRGRRAPVALCMSRIDRMANRRYETPHAERKIAEFFARLNELGWGGDNLSLDVIRQRHKAVVHLRQAIWPRWKIEDQVRDTFGGRHMFFPLTSAGWDHTGEEPLGVTEPLLWLLHMNGYRVLPRRAASKKRLGGRPEVSPAAPPPVIRLPSGGKGDAAGSGIA